FYYLRHILRNTAAQPLMQTPLPPIPKRQKEHVRKLPWNFLQSSPRELPPVRSCRVLYGHNQEFPPVSEWPPRRTRGCDRGMKPQRRSIRLLSGVRLRVLSEARGRKLP